MNLKLHFFSLIAASAMLWAFPGAVAATDKYGGHSDIVFDGDSTLDAFSGEITNVPVKVTCDIDTNGVAWLNTRIEIGPRQLTTHNTKRDANMYRMFQPEQFPRLLIVVSNAPLASAQLTSAGPHSGCGRLPMQVIMCGVTNEVCGKTSNPVSIAEGWEFDLETDLSLKSFKLKPPTLLLGAIAVRDTVKVKAHIKVQKETH